MKKNVKKIDIALQRFKERFPNLRFKAKQKTTITTAKGWGFRVQKQETETIFEPVESKNHEGR